MGGDAGGLGLDDLGAPHFQPFRGDAGVVGHGLGLEWRYPQSAFGKDPAQGGGDDAFAHVGAGAEDGQAGGFGTESG